MTPSYATLRFPCSEGGLCHWPGSSNRTARFRCRVAILRKNNPAGCRSAGSSFDLWVKGFERGPTTQGRPTMKYMLIMRATDEAFAQMGEIDFDQMLETVGRFNDELIRAGVLLAAEGLDDAADGVVVDYSS